MTGKDADEDDALYVLHTLKCTKTIHQKMF